MAITAHETSTLASGTESESHSSQHSIATNGSKKHTKTRRKKKKALATNGSAPGHADESKEDANELDIQVEWVPEKPMELAPGFEQFQDIFKHFQLQDPEAEATVDHGSKEQDSKEAGNKSDDSGSDSEDDAEKQAASKKKLKRLNRMSVAVLKQMAKHPEVVEWIDVTSSDPNLLVQLKGYRNTVPVPAHWSQKRKYLQGKRGIEKLPFELPEFIKDTGIMELRNAVKEKEDASKLKTKTRERVQPKMGKIDIDYQKLHDAFFRYQTRPRLTMHGELYHEGKEFETKAKEVKPGNLSEDLIAALSIPPLAPPPWLINMQRYGPPPGYKNLKIPGLNAPIPEGAQWGYHPGGWGKPPVDEFNRPLYGDVFGSAQTEVQSEYMEPVEKVLWGELDPEEEEEEDEEDEEEEEEGDEEGGEEREEEEEELEEGLVTPSGMQSVASGLETPDFIELRKDSRRATDDADDGAPKSLYTVIPQKQTSITGFMGSQHVYDLASASASSSSSKK
ncbi:Splicing factor 3B subunit 2, partial [Dissophora globulifera]